jgi:hypothetical protein
MELRRMRKTLYAVTALALSPFEWMTPRARLYKSLTMTVIVLLLLALVDAAFVLPALEGWLAVACLTLALTICGYMTWRWHTEEVEEIDLPRKWIAPVAASNEQSIRES